MRIFISGGTGFLGRALTVRLVEHGHAVRVLVRPGSEKRVPAGAVAVPGDPLQPGFSVDADETFVQLTGAPHPAPWKETEFRAIDRASCFASAEVAARAGVRHFVYVSVAQPAPVMRAYIRVRQECEARLRELGLIATVVRPWYVLGPGRRWPLLLKPAYSIAEAIPATREAAVRLGLVTIEEMVRTLVWAVEHPPSSTRVLETREIRNGYGIAPP